MAVTLELENDELASLYFYLQLDEKCQKDPVMGQLTTKMEALVFARFSIDEIEKFREKISGSLLREDGE